MKDEELNKIIKTKCTAVNMCAKGYEQWTDDIDTLLEMAKRENDFIIVKKPFSHKDILRLIPHSLLDEHGIFVDNKNLKEKGREEQGSYLMFLGCVGEFSIKDNSNIIVIADNSDMTLKINSTGFFSIKLFTNSKVNIVLENDCRVMVLNHTDNIVGVKRKVSGIGTCDIKKLKKI